MRKRTTHSIVVSVVTVLVTAAVLASPLPECQADAESPALTEKTIVGELAFEVYETPHPYPVGSRAGDTVWTETITRPDASYITVHFERLELAPDDRLELSDAAGQVVHTYTGHGHLGKGGNFWGLSVPGDTMAIRLIAGDAPHDSYGVRIDRFAHGFPDAGMPRDPEALCGPEDFRDAACYEVTHPTEYDRSRAVVRILMNGIADCTGWLVSCENHLITNQHCIETQSVLDNAEFQFMYQRPGCDSGTPSAELQLMGGTLLLADWGLDYSLIMPNLGGSDPQATYGFLQLDPRLPAINERIYIPGHPSGDPKRLSLHSTHPEDQSGFCEVYSTDAPPCHSGPGDIGYFCDTEGGSSGSPVLSGVNHKVVALHHCAYCPNRGTSILDVYNEIQASSTPLPLCSTEDSPACPQLQSCGGPTCVDDQPCHEVGRLKVETTEWTSCDDNGQVFTCPPGKVIKIERKDCAQCECCSTNPACFCPLDCGEAVLNWCCGTPGLRERCPS